MDPTVKAPPAAAAAAAAAASASAAQAAPQTAAAGAPPPPPPPSSPPMHPAVEALDKLLRRTGGVIPDNEAWGLKGLLVQQGQNDPAGAAVTADQLRRFASYLHTNGYQQAGARVMWALQEAATEVWGAGAADNSLRGVFGQLYSGGGRPPPGGTGNGILDALGALHKAQWDLNTRMLEGMVRMFGGNRQR